MDTDGEGFHHSTILKGNGFGKRVDKVSREHIVSTECTKDGRGSSGKAHVRTELRFISGADHGRLLKALLKFKLTSYKPALQLAQDLQQTPGSIATLVPTLTPRSSLTLGPSLTTTPADS